MWMMLGWLSWAASLASSMNMPMNSALSVRWGRIFLIATVFWKPSTPRERAFQTSAMPPTAIFSSRVYWPKRSPGACAPPPRKTSMRWVTAGSGAAWGLAGAGAGMTGRGAGTGGAAGEGAAGGAGAGLADGLAAGGVTGATGATGTIGATGAGAAGRGASGRRPPRASSSISVRSSVPGLRRTAVDSPGGAPAGPAGAAAGGGAAAPGGLPAAGGTRVPPAPVRPGVPSSRLDRVLLISASTSASPRSRAPSARRGGAGGRGRPVGPRTPERVCSSLRLTSSARLGDAVRAGRPAAGPGAGVPVPPTSLSTSASMSPKMSCEVSL